MILVGLSLLGSVDGSDGSEPFFSLEFEPISSGFGPMQMKKHDAVNSTGDVMGQVQWIGGSVSVIG